MLYYKGCIYIKDRFYVMKWMYLGVQRLNVEGNV